VISELRRLSFQSRRAYQWKHKRRGPDDCVAELQTAQDASKALRVAIRRSQEMSWNDLCRQVDNDPRGSPYKIVAKKLIGRRPIPELKSPGRLDEIIGRLFPRCTPSNYGAVFIANN